MSSLQRFAIAITGLLAAMLVLSPPARAQQVTIPFEPELGTPYLYEMEAWKESGNGRESEVTLVQSLSFERDGYGYTVSIAIERAYVGPDRIAVSRMGPLVDLFGEVILQLDANGYPLRVNNWDDITARLFNAIPIMAASAEPNPARRDQAETFFRNYFTQIANLSPEQAVTASVKHWPGLLGSGGAQMVVGEIYEDTYEQANPLNGSPIRQTTKYRLISADESRLVLQSVTATGTAQMAAIVEETARNSGLDDFEVSEEMRQEFAELGQVQENILTEYDPVTGTVISADIDRGVGGNWERVRIRRISE